MLRRLRRNRKSPAIRALLQETELHIKDLVAPLFVVDGENRHESIDFMPGIHRHSLDFLLKEVERLHKKGIGAIALFPCIETSLRSLDAKESYNPHGLIPRCIKKLKKEFPDLCIFSDVALDPYTSHGHDGIAGAQGEILNDETIEILCKQSLCHAEAGVDVLAPSDMMDGRIIQIRKHLDAHNYSHVSILSYAAKYASALYGPYRNAIQTKLLFGDKKSYHLNPSNIKEALLEAKLDEEEGADMLLIKPATLYLDIIQSIKKQTLLPVGAFHVSGEYAMVMAASSKGYLDATLVFYESLMAIKRAGADFIYTYAYDFLVD